MSFSLIPDRIKKRGLLYSKFTLVISTSLLLYNAAHAQSTIYIEGAQITTMSNAIVHINGSVTHTAGNILHNGTMEVTGDWTNTSLRDSVFDRSSAGVVVLTSDKEQRINGNTTSFPSLTLNPAGNTKLLTTNTLVNGVLSINDNVLDVNGNDMYVRNNASSAITRTTGYVTTSNNPEGRLLQDVVANNTYIFPLGGGIAASTFRYRPLIVTPMGDGTLETQFQDYDPANDGYDRRKTIGNFNDINTNFYHSIGFTNSLRGGTASVAIPFNSTEDGSFSALADWQYYDHWELANDYHELGQNGESTDQVMNFTLVDTGKNVVALANYIENNNLFVVNAFTPNGDGKNDFFVIKGLENYRYNEVKVYNRWGHQLMSERNYQNNWQGDNLPMDTYMYSLKVIDATGIEHFYKGDVEVIR